MPHRVPLPSTFGTQPFLYADARDAGVGVGRLRGGDLAIPFRGVRTPAENPRDGIAPWIALVEAFAPLMKDGQHFSHITAARLWGAPLSRLLEADTQLHVSAVRPMRPPRRKGIVGHESSEPPHTILRRGDFPVSGPEATWLSLGAILPLDELVVVGDHLVLDPAVLDPRDIRPFTTMERLDHHLSRFHGRGARSLASALRLIRAGAESRPETLLRLLLCRAGIPEPRLNVDVTDRDGRVLGRGDLVWPEWRTVVEYDGDQHRTSAAQYDRDIHRLDSFRGAGWGVVQVRSRGLFVNQHETIARVASALYAHGWAK